MRSCAILAALAVALSSTRMTYAESDLELVDSSLNELLGMTVSTAARYDQAVTDAPSSVTIITSDDIERFGYRTVAEVLGGVRGLYATNDRNYQYVGIRGFGRPTDYNNRILLLVNGVRYNEPIWGAAAFNAELGLSTAAVDRIEVVRGPGSALYGANAMFAVVNVITRTGNDIDGARASLEVGSFGERQGEAMFGREFASGLDVAVSGRWQDRDGDDLYFAEYDDPSTNDGVAAGLDWEESYGLTARATYGRWSIQGLLVAREKGIPTGSYETDFNDSRGRSQDDHHLAQVKYERDLGAATRLTLSAGHASYYYEGDWVYEGSISPDEAQTNTASAGVQLLRDLSPINRLVIGAEYVDNYEASYSSWDEWEVYFDEDRPYQVASAYAQDEHQLTPNLALTLGFRGDRYSTVGWTTAPRAALVYHPRATTTLKLLYGEAFRAPGMYEIHYDDGQTIRNPDLKPEEITTSELVWEQQVSDHLTSTASLYRYSVRRLIDQVSLVEDDLQIQHRNVDKVTANGLELQIDGRFDRGVTAYASYTWQNAENSRSNRKLTNQPSHLLKGGLSFPLGGQFTLSPEARYESSRKTVWGTTTDSYLLVNMRLDVMPRIEVFAPLAALSDHIELSLTIGNLLDTDYATPGGLEHLQRAIPQDGRKYLVRVDYRL